MRRKPRRTCGNCNNRDSQGACLVCRRKNNWSIMPEPMRSTSKILSAVCLDCAERVDNDYLLDHEGWIINCEQCAVNILKNIVRSLK